MRLFKPEFIVLTLILIIGAFFHFYNLSYPAKPVFDEAHFATYAANIAGGNAHFDIHPPLAKPIYALTLKFFPAETYKNKIFLETAKNPLTDKLENKRVGDYYNDFPYIPLRATSALFGLSVIIAAYLFLKSLTGKILPALFFAAFIAFENSLLLETRLILLNGVFLFLGLLSLYFYFREKPMPLTAGIIWGLALSAKLVALGFLGAVIGHLLVTSPYGRSAKGKQKEEQREILKKVKFFVAGGFATFLIVFVVLNNAFVPAEARLTLYKDLLGDVPAINADSKILPYAQATLIEMNLMLSGYTTGVGPHPAGSKWYEWPFMIRPIGYFPYLEGGANPEDRALILFGNPFLWAFGTAAIIILLLRFIKNRFRDLREKNIWRSYSAVISFRYYLSFFSCGA